MASKHFNKGSKKLTDGTIDWDDNSTTTIRCMLIRDTYTFNPDHEFVSDIVSHELTVTGTVRKEITNRTIVVNGSPTNTVVYKADNPSTWTSLSSTPTSQVINAIVIYKFVSTDANSHLLSFLDVTDTATTGGNFSITFGSGEVFALAN